MRPARVLSLFSLVLVCASSQAQGSKPGIKWFTSLVKANEAAHKSNRPMLIDFYATWCGPCKALDRFTYTDKRIISMMKNVVAVRLDIDTKEGREVAKYLGVGPIPTVIVYDRKGVLKGGFKGFRPPKEFETQLKQRLGS